jgi:hypothetical protein
LTPTQKLLKLELEGSLEEKKEEDSSAEGRAAEKKLPINPNHFVTELVRYYR